MFVRFFASLCLLFTVLGANVGLAAECSEDCEMRDYAGRCTYRASCEWEGNCVTRTSCARFDYADRCEEETVSRSCSNPGTTCSETCQKYDYANRCIYRTQCEWSGNCVKETSCEEFDYADRCSSETTRTTCG